MLDAFLPEFNGLDLQKRVAIERPDISIIFLSEHANVPTTVQAMKAGAVEFFLKPFREEALLSSIREALERSRASLVREA